MQGGASAEAGAGPCSPGGTAGENRKADAACGGGHIEKGWHRGRMQDAWIEQLLPLAVHPRFVVLGSCEGIRAVIEGCAHRMKAVRWILKEQDYTPELTDFVEEFCEEYGLAIALQTVPGRAAFRKLRLDCTEPVNILDFTEETAIPISGIAEGSVWLDMLSSEEKKRRIAWRGTGIRYFSLKEKWKRG